MAAFTKTQDQVLSQINKRMIRRMEEEKRRAKREINLIEKWGEDEALKIEGAGGWEDLLMQEEEDEIGYLQSLVALQTIGGRDGSG